MNLETISGRYQLKDRIGIGGMGTVYLAHDNRIGRDVALKLLPRHLSSDPTFTERFQQEAQIIGQLEHPNIVPIYDVGEDDGRPYLVMRFLPGGTLRDQMKKVASNKVLLLTMLKQIGNALDVAHAQNIVHRDLKPSNILFDRNRTAYLADFGIAKVVDSAMKITAKSMTVGTPYYMSPEQFSAEWEVGGYSDQYSLAVVLFEILSGEVPFDGANTAQVMFKHLTKSPPRIHEINNSYNVALSDVLNRALSKTPDERYNSVTEFVEACTEAILTRPEKPKPTGQDVIPGNIDETILSTPGSIDETILSQPGNIDETILSTPGSIDETILAKTADIEKAEPVKPYKTEKPQQSTADSEEESPLPPSEEPATEAPPAPSKNDLEAYYQEGLRALHREDWETAENAFESVTKIDPSYRSARVLLNQAARERNRMNLRRPLRGDDLNVQDRSAAQETFLLEPQDVPKIEPAEPKITPAEPTVTIIPGAGGVVTKPTRRPRVIYLIGGLVGLVILIGLLLFIFGVFDRTLDTPSTTVEATTSEPAAKIQATATATTTPLPTITIAPPETGVAAQILSAGAGATIVSGGEERSLEADDLIEAGNGSLVRVGSDPVEILLSDDTWLLLAFRTEVELVSVAGFNDATVTHLSLNQGVLILQTRKDQNHLVRITNPHGDEMQIENGRVETIVGLIYNVQSRWFGVECLKTGPCNLINRNNIGISLNEGEWVQIREDGQLSDIGPARYELYSPFSDNIPTSTPTLTPTETPSPTSTPLPRPTFTLTPIPSNTPLPRPPTSTPLPPSPTNTPIPPSPTNTPIPPLPTITPIPLPPTSTPSILPPPTNIIKPRSQPKLV